MKKFFSLIALAGVFAACQPETIETAFTVNGASAEITVNVVEAGTLASVSGFSVAATSTGLAPTVSGNKITFQAATGATISPMTVTVTVTVPDYYDTFTTVVAVPEILAGGHAELTAQVVVYPAIIDDWSFTLEEEEPVVVLADTRFLENVHYPTYSHAYTHTGADEYEVDIETWYLNDSEYILEGTVEYPIEFSAELVDDPEYDYVGFEYVVDDFAETVVEGWKLLENETVGELPIKVSAYGMWTAFENFFSALYYYEVVGKNSVTNETVTVGSFAVNTNYCVTAQFIELGMPTHVVGHGSGHNLVGHDHTSGHVTPVYEHYYYEIYSKYQYGHGADGHGKYNNAGGGIADAE